MEGGHGRGHEGRDPRRGQAGVSMRQLARILAYRQRLRRRERWTRTRLEAHQAQELAALRAFAMTHSPLYRDFHHGLEHASLSELPILTKATLMQRFDEVVTDPVLCLSDLQRYLEELRDDELFASRYWVSATSGSSGLRSIVPSDRPAPLASGRSWSRDVSRQWGN